MNIDHIATVVYQELQRVSGNAHHEVNLDDPVTYPYLTYTLTAEHLTTNSDGYYLDIDLFDKDTTFNKLLELETKLRDAFQAKQIDTDQAYIMFNFNSSDNIRTIDEALKRRNLRFYLKVWWKKPVGIQRQSKKRTSGT